MKKTLAVLLIFALLFAPSCRRAEDLCRQKYPEYYGLSTFKGLELYAWRTEDGAIACGLLPGTNRRKEADEIERLKENGATLAEMKVILSDYPDIKGNVLLCPNEDGITNADLAEIEEYLPKE